MKIKIPNGGSWEGAVGEIASFLCSTSSQLSVAMTRGGGSLVLALSGPLGAGKTTFVQALARILGSKDIVKSPTFTLRNTYTLTKPPFTRLVHVDAYRLENTRDVLALGLDEELAVPGTLVAIEWPEHIPESYFKHAPVVRVEILINEEGSRMITVS